MQLFEFTKHYFVVIISLILKTLFLSPIRFRQNHMQDSMQSILDKLAARQSVRIKNAAHVAKQQQKEQKELDY